MTTELANKQCVPCRGGVPPLKGDQLDPLVAQLGDDWKVVDDHHLEKTYDLASFRESLAFVNDVGDIAESEGHHPNIFLSFRKVTIKLFTHKIDGLTESDFILAAKCDAAYNARAATSEPD